MALIDDVLGGGNVVAGLAIGAAGLVAWPLMRPPTLRGRPGGPRHRRDGFGQRAAA